MTRRGGYLFFIKEEDKESSYGAGELLQFMTQGPGSISESELVVSGALARCKSSSTL
jgi:hypothetical protein